METKEGRKEMNVKRICLAALFGSILALGSSCILLLLFAALIAAGWIPEGAMGFLGPIACFLSVLLGGCFAVRKGEGAPLVLGLSTGIVMCFLMLFIGLTAFDASCLQGSNFISMASALVGGAVAGFCKPQKQTRRKTRRR
jgi:putative membrane protein (TIGR04086 family)